MTRHEEYRRKSQIAPFLALPLLLLGLAPAGAEAGEMIWQSMKVGARPVTSAAQEAHFRDCEHQVSVYGQGVSYVDGQCIEDFLAAADPGSVKQSEDESIVAVGHRNLLAVRTAYYPKGAPLGTNNFKDMVIGGPNSGLHAIRGVSLDSVHGEIFVLEGSNDSLVSFRVGFEGNVPQLRRVQAPELSGASAITSDPGTDEIFVASRTSGKILVFDRRASGNVRPARVIEGAQSGLVGASSIAEDPVHHELFVLDDVADQILVFDASASGAAAPVRQIRGAATGLRGARGISYSASTDELLIRNGAGGLLRFSRVSDGNAVPTARSD